MSDTLKDAGIAIAGLFLFSWLLNQRAEHAVKQEVARAVRGMDIHATVAPRGLFGLAVGQAYRVRVFGSGFQTDTIPFRLVPGGGLRASVRHLTLDFQNVTLRNLTVRSLRADIPFVTLDANQVFWNERIVLRTAGQGRGEAVLEAEALRVFLARKFPALKEPRVTLLPGRAQLNAEVLLFGVRSQIEARGRLAVLEGRYILIVDPLLRVNGKETTPQFAQAALKPFNPILDIEKDLGLGGFVTVEDVEIGEGILTVRGRATVPRQGMGNGE